MRDARGTRLSVMLAVGAGAALVVFAIAITESDRKERRALYLFGLLLSGVILAWALKA